MKPTLERLKEDAPKILAKHKDGQQHKAIEEMGELIAVLARGYCGKLYLEHVREEIADVMIMMYQMRDLYGEAEVDRYIETKLDRTLK